MLIRISLIIVIVAGLAVGVLNFVTVRDKITTLQTDVSNEKTARASAEGERDKSKRDLASAKAQLDATNQVLLATAAERDKAVADALAQIKRATQVGDELAKTKKDRDDAQAELAAFRATGVTPAQVMTLSKTNKQILETLASVQEESRVFAQNILQLQNELAFYRDPTHIVPLPANLKGNILVFDPKWDFVVLDVGQDQGVLQRGEFLVNRNGKLVAKVIVTSVQRNRSIANVMPGWKLGEVMEGDQVIPAHPAS